MKISYVSESDEGSLAEDNCGHNGLYFKVIDEVEGANFEDICKYLKVKAHMHVLHIHILLGYKIF